MSKSWYRAAPGVAWVNGAAVPDHGRVHLTAEEAAFDLGLGRIAKEEPGAQDDRAHGHVLPDAVDDALPLPRRRRRQVK